MFVAAKTTPRSLYNFNSPPTKGKPLLIILMCIKPENEFMFEGNKGRCLPLLLFSAALVCKKKWKAAMSYQVGYCSLVDRLKKLRERPHRFSIRKFVNTIPFFLSFPQEDPPILSSVQALHR